MQQFQTEQHEESQPSQHQSHAAPHTAVGIEAEGNTLTAQNVTEHLNDITRHILGARRRFGICNSAILAWSMMGLIAAVFLQATRNPYSVMLAFIVVITQFPAIVLLHWYWNRTVTRVDAAEVAKVGGVQAIAPLFALAHTVNRGKQRRQHKAIQDALMIVLPQMTASDAHLLTPDARRRIRIWIDMKFETINTAVGMSCPDDLRIAALKALEQVGNSDDIELVERLANMKTRTSAQERVKQAAIECLPMLREHCGEAASARTLLRASNAEDARPDTLLRAATGLPETSPAELLRGAKKP